MPIAIVAEPSERCQDIADKSDLRCTCCYYGGEATDYQACCNDSLFSLLFGKQLLAH